MAIHVHSFLDVRSYAVPVLAESLAVITRGEELPGLLQGLFPLVIRRGKEGEQAAKGAPTLVKKACFSWLKCSHD